MIMSTTALEPSSGAGPKRGWCPGALDPMETGDGWLLRIRVPGGYVTAASLRTMAALADEFGSGVLEITSRANLQIRGVAKDRLEQAVAAVVDSGLVADNARLDALRAVVSNPLTGHDPAAVCNAQPVVEALLEQLRHRIVGFAPSKFGIVVDDAGGWPVEDIDADVSIRARPDRTWEVRLRNTQTIGSTLDPVGVVEAATQWCVDEAMRMDRLVSKVGISSVVARLALIPPGVEVADLMRPKRAGRLIGTLRHPDEARSNVVAAPFLGRLTAAALADVGALAAAHGADVRLTPDRSIAFCGVARIGAVGLVDELVGLGLVADRDDPRASFSACVGSAGCLWAHADTMTAAVELAVGGEARERVHLSACGKGCGAPSGVRHLVADANGTFR